MGRVRAGKEAFYPWWALSWCPSVLDVKGRMNGGPLKKNGSFNTRMSSDPLGRHGIVSPFVSRMRSDSPNMWEAVWAERWTVLPQYGDKVVWTQGCSDSSQQRQALSSCSVQGENVSTGPLARILQCWKPVLGALGYNLDVRGEICSLAHSIWQDTGIFLSLTGMRVPLCGQLCWGVLSGFQSRWHPLLHHFTDGQTISLILFLHK